jgi:hypothetical protein
MQAFYTGESSRGSKFLVFLLICILILSFGMATMMGFLRYNIMTGGRIKNRGLGEVSERMAGRNMGVALIMQVLLTDISAMIVFLGRKLPDYLWP